MLKRLVKHKKTLSFFGWKSFKNQENIKQKQGPGIFSENRKFLAKTGGLESKQFILRTSLVITQFAEYGRTRQDLTCAEPFFAPFSFNYLDISHACTCHTLQTGLMGVKSMTSQIWVRYSMYCIVLYCILVI